MKIAYLPRIIFPAFLLIVLTSPGQLIQAQNPTSSSLRSTPNEIEKDDPLVSQIITRAENHFRQGELNLADNKLEQARDEFDKAVDVILEAGLDVRSRPRLRDYYLQLIERVYREEVPAVGAPAQTVLDAQVAQVINVSGQQTEPAQPRVGFRDQKFEPSPLDDLSRLELTPEEQNVLPGDVEQLEVAKNAVNFPFTTNALIQQFINYYQGRGRSTMEAGLRRSGLFMKMARRIFREEGVPEDIAWLAQVESAWRPNAYSSAAASGLWQFVPSTGWRFGLRQTAWIDERNSFEKATRASASYLKWLSNRYGGNWELAMAAYNTGEGNVDRAIARAGASDFWAVYPYVAQQTRNYVPNILATILIAKNPEKYGFRGIRPDAPLGYDVVRVPSATGLQLVASACDTSIDYIRGLNPELHRDITPRGEPFDLRIPAGRSKSFVVLLKRIPPDRREYARVLSVGAGEDWGSLAARSGTTPALLQSWNTGFDLKSGGKVVLPPGSVRNVAYTYRRPNAPAVSGSNLITVRAVSGDTATRIAARYNASSDDVARLNGVEPNAVLAAGQVIKVPAQANAPAPVVKRPARRR